MFVKIQMNILFITLVIVIFLSACSKKVKGQGNNEDLYRQEYRHSPQAQSIYGSEDDYVEDRLIEEKN